MLAIAQRENLDLLIRLEREPVIHFREGRGFRHSFDTLVSNAAAFGFAARDFVFVDEPDAQHEPGLARIPEPARGLLLPFPSIGTAGDEPPRIGFDIVMPLTVFVDAAGQPFATIDCEGVVDVGELHARVERARAVRRARDEAFAVAAATTGKDRIGALHRGLSALDRWLVVRCYAPQLRELVASGVPTAVDCARPLLREHQVLRACRSLRAAGEEIDTIDPRRLRRQLDEVVREFPDLPEVAFLAHCVHASAELRLAVDEADRDRIVARVRAATGSVEVELPWIRQLAAQWLTMASRWQPR